MDIMIERYSDQQADIDWGDLQPILQRIYHARGITSPNDLKTDLASLLPFQELLNIDQAVTVLFSALEKQHKVTIIGDFDADGATSTVIAMLALKKLGFKSVNYLVPNRFEYGYGLTPEIVDVAAKDNPQLIITVDNGISSIAGVTRAKALNIDVLITDHHLAGDELPDAAAIVNPNQPNDQFKSKNLAGCGVIFYVLLAFRSYLRDQNYFKKNNLTEPNMAELLDVVALGTVADVVKLDKNNRILVAQGLKRIRSGHCRPGIQALIKIAGRELDKISATDLGFIVGPRLNAAGRLEDMSVGIECLLTEDLTVATELAQQLDTLNHERRDIEDEMREQAFAALDQIKIDAKAIPYGISLFNDTWHQGVIGIVASRIKDKYHRPVIAFAIANESELKGSARSIPGLHIRDALDAIAKKYPALITKFGGHAMAAGLSLQKNKLPEFQLAFDEQVKNTLTEYDLQKKIMTDGDLSVQELNLELAETLRQAGPWGQGFPEPLFDGIFDVIEQRIVGQKHLRLQLKLGDKLVNGICFNINLTDWPNHRCQKVHIVYRLDINKFRDISSVQLLIEQIKIA